MAWIHVLTWIHVLAWILGCILRCMLRCVLCLILNLMSIDIVVVVCTGVLVGDESPHALGIIVLIRLGCVHPRMLSMLVRITHGEIFPVECEEE